MLTIREVKYMKEMKYLAAVAKSSKLPISKWNNYCYPGYRYMEKEKPHEKNWIGERASFEITNTGEG